MSVGKPYEDVINLRFVSVGKPQLPNNKARTISFSLTFRISELIALRSSKRTFR